MEPIDGTITNPDDALAEARQLRDALRDALAVNALMRFPAVSGEPAAQAGRLLDLEDWIDRHCSAGGALPTPWAHDRTARDDPRPVADRRLPGDPRPIGDDALMVLAGAAARVVTREHTPHKSRRSRTAQPADYCRQCGQPWPCQARTMAAALLELAP